MLAIAIFVLISGTAALPVQNGDSEAKNETEIDYRLPNTTVPIHYNLKIIPDIDGDSGFEGEISIKFKVLDPTSNIVLHMMELEVDENATRVVLENGGVIVPEVHEHDNETQKLTIGLGTVLKEGVYWLNMKFLGDIRDDLFGCFKSSYEDEEGNTVWVVATQFEATYARYAFPCWDEPALKATYNISIKHYDNYTAMSNMPAREKSYDETDGKVWTHFERTPIMSSYLVAFVIADYENVSNSDGSINIVGRRELIPYFKFALEIAEKAARELEQYTNSTVRVPKMDHVALPQHATGAMENWGLITYPERNLAFNEEEDSFDRKYSIATTVVHELAHQWFGNVVSPKSWSHIWLNEGFASYFQQYIVDKILKEWRNMDYFIARTLQFSLTMDIEWNANPIDTVLESPDQIESAFSISVYNKAPSILHMLANIVTPEVFRRGLIGYLDKHEFDSADPDCLWGALQTALDNSDVPHNDYNLREVMNTWIKQKRYPLVTVERNYSTGDVTFEQEDYVFVHVHENEPNNLLKDNNETYQWWVPITYTTGSNLNFEDTRTMNWLRPDEVLTVEGIDPEDWIIVNKKQSGYYRVNYDETNWRKIARYLRSENFTNIHVLTRAQIMSDITDLVMFNRVERSVFLDLVLYMKQEEDFPPWSHLLYLTENYKLALQYPSAKPIKAFMLSIMENLIKNIGYEDDPKDTLFTVLMRAEVLEAACLLGHDECIKMAADKMADFLDDPNKYKKSAHLSSWMYDNAGRRANESLWYKMLEMCERNNSVEMLAALSYTENVKLFKVYLNLSISDNTTLSDKYKAAIIRFAFRNPLFLDDTINFCLRHWEKLKESVKGIFYNIDFPLNEERTEKMTKLCERSPHCNMEKFMTNLPDDDEIVERELDKWSTAIKNMG
ncbi:aminopeptidase N-like [Megachile rotundata]|uniref:aminopeptidase N-like n=1 Tax=Megachile rotundata TaxID=143995 RepID=UPI003FD0130C